MQRPYRGITKDGKLLYGDKATADDRTYIIGGTHDENGDVQWLYVEVIPETVGQSTGFKDRNEVKIFKGDKITLSYGIPPKCETLVIEYADNESISDISVSGWWMRNTTPNGCSASLCKTYENDIEIIGTIHDHLLEKGK